MMRLVLLLCLLPAFAWSQSKVQLLGPWQLSNLAGNIRCAAPVPGRIYDALYAASIIPHPYFNEDSVQWVGHTAWQYSTQFNIDTSQGPWGLVFEGIDTHAELYLNGHFLGKSDNAFHPHRFSLPKVNLRPANNQLDIIIHPIGPINDSMAAAWPMRFPEAERVFVRKPAFHFGWDWGPRLTAGGLTGPVRLESIQQARIASVAHQLEVVADSLAVLHWEIALTDWQPGYRLRMLLSQNEQPIYISNDNLLNSSATVTFSTPVHQPAWWWPNQHGEQPLYEVNLRLFNNGNTAWQQLDEHRFKIGLRTIALLQKADSIGESFHFEVNGRPIFIKGANYIPTSHLDAAQQRSTDSSLLYQSAAAGMNMIRVWGGGIYPGDHFYELADALGLLIWQDFMFACAMYPADSAFTQRVAREVDYQVKRLRHHPSLALWCGNNENWEGWQHWGWQSALHYSASDSMAVATAYRRLFQEQIPRQLAALDPQRSYTHSSPLRGWGNAQAYTHGDVHYWGVWWGLEPLENYRLKTGRFVSEYGMQSFPEYQSLRQMAGPDSLPLRISDPRLRQHQKHPTGFETIHTYLQREFTDPPNLALYAYASQLLQLRAMETAIEAHRAAMPYCMGTLFWQLNDAWPAISWSAMDYYGRPKAFYHGLKRLFAPQLIAVQAEGASQKVRLVNEAHDSLAATLEMRLWSLRTGRIRSVWQKALVLPPNQVFSAGEVPPTYLRRLQRGHSVLQIRLLQTDTVLAAHVWSPLKPKAQHWRHPEVHVERVSPAAARITVQKPARHLHLESNSFCSDNYFDLMPGESKVVYFFKDAQHTQPDEDFFSRYDLLIYSLFNLQP